MAWGVHGNDPQPAPADLVELQCVTCRGRSRFPKKAARYELTLNVCRSCGGQRYFKRPASVLTAQS
jgi:hypothetical protein